MNQLPTLYAKGSKKSDILQWRTWALGPDVYFEYGKIGGKMQKTHYTAKPTNEGRANFRDPVAQALFESNSSWEKKIKEGYYTDIEVAKTAEVILPMLAHRYDKQGKKMKWPNVSGQYKYNGLRCLVVCSAPGELRLISRGNETWNLPHISAACAAIMNPGDMLDGEVYVHGISLQIINSLVKKYRPESQALQFYIYDAPRIKDQELEWKDRAIYLEQLFETKVANAPVDITAGYVSKTLCLAKTIHIKDEEAATNFEREAVVSGYEGVILRNWEGEYRFDYRSYDVLKWKRFQDSEFTIVDMRPRVFVNSATGKQTEIVDVCICQNNLTPATFEVVPRGSTEVKADYWVNRAKYLGSKLVVRYLERSDTGIPQGNPVGVSFRLDEDLDKELEGDEESLWS